MHTQSFKGMWAAVVRRAANRQTVRPWAISPRWASTSAAKVTGKAYKPLPDGWEAVIGVEVHAQLKTQQKLFSKANTPNDRVGAQSPANTCVAPFDAALPGTLPMLQEGSLRIALRACLALECKVGAVVTFDRKHYFYPDLTSGFQISQKYNPLAKDGRLRLLFDDGHLPTVEDEVDVRIEQIQLEQDTAKSAHHTSDTSGPLTTVDLNRAGSALIEIVSGPDMRTPEQAGAYMRKLRETLRRTDVSDGNMDEGSLRCDINVSVHRQDEPWGMRCEVKNLNSVRFAMNAIEHEMHRQHALLQAGTPVEQETRGYNESDGTTYRLRSKEDSPEYRYMPDPNLPPLRIDTDLLRQVKAEMPELPDTQRARLMQQYKVGLRDVNVLMRVGIDDEDYAARRHRSKDAVAYYELVARGRDGQATMNWVIHELLKALNAQGKSFRDNVVTAVQLGTLLDLVHDGKVTMATARALLSEVISTQGTVLDAHRDAQQDDVAAIRALLHARDAFALDTGDAVTSVCQEIVDALPDVAAAVRGGDEKKMSRLMGEVMKRTKGRANAKAATRTIKSIIESS